MNNVLLMLGAILVGVLAALVAVPMVIDWNGYRGVFEEEASRLLGRDVRLGGGVNVRVLPVPYVRFEKLRIADTSSTGGDPLFRAESVTMRLSIAPLLRGVLEAQSIELKKPSLRLAVDGSGRGNWHALAFRPGSLPFVPADVTLQSVGIEGGTLVFVGPAGKELAEFQSVNGELSAEGFEGPFKFKGTASWYGDAREIRFSTSRSEADGATRFRATVRLPSNQNNYLFDGRIVDLKGRPRIDGDLSAKLPLALQATTPANSATNSAANSKPAVVPIDPDANTFELKAKVDGDLNGGKLTDIALSLDRVGDPQLITGEATAAWGEGLRFDMGLASRSLNLDTIGGDMGATGYPPPKDPLEKAASALSAILAMLPADARTDARLKAERVTLAGQPVSGVSLEMNRRGPALEVKELRAVLPGNTRLDASGIIGGSGQSSSFTGPVTLRGANLARFVSWARGEGLPRTAQGEAGRSYDGPFLLDGQLAMSPANLALTRATAEFADQPITGEFRVSTQGRRRLSVMLQGNRIDAAQIWPGGIEIDRLKSFLAGTPSAMAISELASNTPAGVPPDTGAANTGFYGFNPDTTDMRVEIRVGEFHASDAVRMRDVDAAFSMDRGQLSVQRLRFQSQSALSVELDGQLAGLTLAPPIAKTANQVLVPRKGVLRFLIGAPNAAAVQDLMSHLSWPTPDRPSDQTIATLGALRLAGSVTLGERGPASTLLAIDGTVDGGRVVVAANLESGWHDWRASGLDLTATIDTPDTARWLAIAGLGLSDQTGARNAPRSGQVFIKAVGRPSSGLTTLASLASDEMSVAYQGSVTLPKAGVVTADGAAGVVARDSSDVLALFDVALGQGRTGAPVQGQIVINQKDASLQLTLSDMRVGTRRLNGTGTLQTVQGSDPARPPTREVRADLVVDGASLPDLLALVSDRRVGRQSASIQPADNQTSGGQSRDGARTIWPEQPLSWAGLDRMQGQINLAVDRLSLDNVTMLNNAKAQVRFTPTGIALHDVTGNGLGGALSARLEFQKSPGGTSLTAEASLTGANLNATLPLSLTASVRGQGVSPSDFLASLQGRGEASVGAGQIKGIGPAGVAATVDAVLADKVPVVGDQLAQVLRDALAPTSLTLNARKIPFTVSNGFARIPTTLFETPQGRASLEGTVDLNLGRFVTDWRIDAPGKPGVTGKPKAPLPAVVVTMSGGLANLAEVDGKLTLNAFEQELGLRKLERDAEELERIRKLDEERRQKEIAEEAARTAAKLAAESAAATNAPPASAELAPGSASNQATPPAAGTVSPTNAAPPPTPEPTTAAKPPSQGSLNRKRAQDSFPQPLQNNF